MRVLIACEFSGKVRDAFIDAGHDALSCDLLPGEGKYKQFHYQGDVLRLIKERYFDLMIAHPPCTYLSSSGLHWNCRTPTHCEKTWEAIKFAEKLWAAPINKIAIENPIGCLGTFSNLRKYSQIIQPYNFGADASKSTCLWLKNLPPLSDTSYFPPRVTPKSKKVWGNQTDSGQNKLTPSATRALDRAVTYQGIADAMAKQWGNLQV